VNSPTARVRTEAEASVPPARDKLLFTPGPLTTSLTVKQRMLHDAGSWHFEFNEVVARIREGLLLSLVQ
jgi:2-aminoethylphosphonate-pyruvate transaminase